jgi:hypothetical protein
MLEQHSQSANDRHRTNHTRRTSGKSGSAAPDNHDKKYEVLFIVACWQEIHVPSDRGVSSCARCHCQKTAETEWLSLHFVTDIVGYAFGEDALEAGFSGCRVHSSSGRSAQPSVHDSTGQLCLRYSLHHRQKFMKETGCARREADAAQNNQGDPA